MVLIFVYLLIRGPATPWGDVSQALIYHQVTVQSLNPSLTTVYRLSPPLYALAAWHKANFFFRVPI